MKYEYIKEKMGNGLRNYFSDKVKHMSNSFEKLIMDSFAEGYQTGYIEGCSTKDHSDEWIPVISGKLPEIGDYVLVTVRDDYTTNNIQVKQYTGLDYWKNGRILAWKPLSEPYREGEEDE